MWTTSRRMAGAAGRHPVAMFLLALLPLSVLLHLLWANLAGGWAVWGDDILWYRATCVIEDLVLAAGAYAAARIVAGPLWFKDRTWPPWVMFVGVCAGGGLFLMILSRRLVDLYVEAPPMATGWLPVWQRTWLPLFLLWWVRRQWMALPWYERPQPRNW
jgi:hypothetical protein